MSDTTPARIDAHCHVFGLSYLKDEVIWMITPHFLHLHSAASTDGALMRSAFSMGSVVTGVADLIRWLKQMTEAAVGDERSNLEMVLEECRKAAPSLAPEQVAAVVLMMDIAYMLRDPLGPRSNQAGIVKATGNSLESAIESKAIKTAAIFSHASDSKGKTIQSSTVESALADLRTCLGMAGFVEGELEELMGNAENHSRSLVRSIEGDVDGSLRLHLPFFGHDDDDQSPGFVHHRDALIRLKADPTFSKRMLPFYAVDPRRPGTIKYAMANVGKGKPFQGIKLYPRLGYHPDCAELGDLYEWCADNDIPITTHCNPTGFPPIGGHSELGNPENFRPVLERHKNLRIDFAHFGNTALQEIQQDWTATIIDLMSKYPNVYADLACIADQKDLQAFKNAHWTSPNVQDRCFFGTDFDVVYFTKISTNLEQYYSQFAEVFSGTLGCKISEMDALARRNPARFLASVL